MVSAAYLPLTLSIEELCRG